jgi:EAL domain-containing protein (putative c-di-GMP-specific phosphodiesterase class I)
LPVDTLKIDKSFLEEFSDDSRAIVTAILAMGHSLGLNVVAEGVETAEQLHYLREHECDAAQGLLLSAPMDAEALRGFLHAST